MGGPIDLNAVARARSALEAARAEHDTAMRLEAPLRMRRLRAAERLERERAVLRRALEGAPPAPDEAEASFEDLVRRHEGAGAEG